MPSTSSLCWRAADTLYLFKEANVAFVFSAVCTGQLQGNWCLELVLESEKVGLHLWQPGHWASSNTDDFTLFPSVVGGNEWAESYKAPTVQLRRKMCL